MGWGGRDMTDDKQVSLLLEMWLPRKAFLMRWPLN